MSTDLHPIIKAWIDHLKTPEVTEFVNLYGMTRRVDVTLYSDRGRLPKPPTLEAKLGRDTELDDVIVTGVGGTKVT